MPSDEDGQPSSHTLAGHNEIASPSGFSSEVVDGEEDPFEYDDESYSNQSWNANEELEQLEEDQDDPDEDLDVSDVSPRRYNPLSTNELDRL